MQRSVESENKLSVKKSKPAKSKDRATQYAADVISGAIVAGPHVRAACQRHLNDRQKELTNPDYKFYYDEHAASEGVAFFEECLCLNGGQFEGKPFLLFPWEAFIIGNIFGWKRKTDDTRRFRVVFIETGKGPLALDTPIATSTGWTTMGEIKVGDKVFNSQGQLTSVIKVSPIFYEHQCYRLRFSDGDEIVADAEHEWDVCSLRNGKIPVPRNDAKVGEHEKINTAHIAKTYRLPPSLSKHPQPKWNHRIDVAPALNLPDINLPIAPYTLGAWLGDGDSDAARITCEDEEIIDNIKADGYIVGNKYYKPNNKAFRQPIGMQDKNICRRGHKKEHGNKCRLCDNLTERARRNGNPVPKQTYTSLSEILGRLNLYHNKHIPAVYFRSSIAQRLSLLQGILDTDGYIGKKGHCEITLCSKILINDVAELLRGLGFKCAIKESAAVLNKIEVGRRWRITFQAYKSFPPVRLQRKIKNLCDEPKTRPLSRGRMIIGCDPVETVPVKCITVDSDDHLFLAGKNLIPTANSGKSPLCAGTGIYGLVADHEERAEIYAAATFKDQAMVLFRDACAFFDQSVMLQERLIASGVGEKRWNLAYLATNSFFRVIATDTKKGKSGPRPHMALLDEIHEHADGSVIEMLRAGFKFRRQPLSFMITNSGHDMTSVCREYHDLGVKIAHEIEENDEFFSFICSLDDADFLNADGEEDEHYLIDEALWPKVNPSLPYGIPGYDYIRSQIKEAKGLPSKMSTVKRLNFCVWTESENPAIDPEVWKACMDKDYPIDILAGRRCWGGLDLSAVNDLTALALMFEPGYINLEKVDGVWTPVRKPVYDPFWRLKVWFWLPGNGLQLKADTDHVPYIAWRDAKYMIASKGAAISKSEVVKFISESPYLPQLQGIAYDRSRMKDLMEFAEKAGIELNIGKWDKEKKRWDFKGRGDIRMMPFGQEARSMAPAIDKFEYMLIEKLFRHEGNPCLTWNAANTVMSEDEDGYRKVSKKKSITRVDGITSTVMACGILDDTGQKSAYDGLSKEEMMKKLRGEL